MDASGEIVELAGGCPWKEHMYGLEIALNLERRIKFCIYEVRCQATRLDGCDILDRSCQFSYQYNTPAACGLVGRI